MIAGLLAACTKTGEERENEKPKAEESHVKRGAWARLSSLSTLKRRSALD